MIFRMAALVRQSQSQTRLRTFRSPTYTVNAITDTRLGHGSTARLSTSANDYIPPAVRGVYGPALPHDRSRANSGVADRAPLTRLGNHQGTDSQPASKTKIPHSRTDQVRPPGSPADPALRRTPLVWKRKLNNKLAWLLRREYPVYVSIRATAMKTFMLKKWAVSLGLGADDHHKVMAALHKLRDAWAVVYLCRSATEFNDVKWGTAVDLKNQHLNDCCEEYYLINTVMERYHGYGWMSGSGCQPASRMVLGARGRVLHAALLTKLRASLVRRSTPLVAFGIRWLIPQFNSPNSF